MHPRIFLKKCHFLKFSPPLFDALTLTHYFTPADRVGVMRRWVNNVTQRSVCRKKKWIPLPLFRVQRNIAKDASDALHIFSYNSVILIVGLVFFTHSSLLPVNVSSSKDVGIMSSILLSSGGINTPFNRIGVVRV